MRDSLLPKEAQADYFCPLAMPQRVNCLGNECMAWEYDVEGGGGYGDCSLLVRRREIVNGIGPNLVVSINPAGV